MFERSLSSLIKGLRSHRGKDEARYVATLMDEIKDEIRGGDMEIKAEAVLKLSYLQMLGYAPSNASFHMLEVMASPRYHLKQVGYLAASQCFTQDTEVLILATNMIKKDLRSPNSLDVAVALNGLSHIITPDLAQHLAPDVVALLTHSKPIIRKRALLVLHAVILHYPPTLEQCLGRFSDKLEDTDTGVVSSAVNIICELSRRDGTLAKAFLPLSPQLFELLRNSTNNWMLIKVVKLFGILSPLEPRLAKRLLPPIMTLIQTTPAMSLLYECMHTVIIGGMLEAGAGGDELAQTCSDKLGVFLNDDDQNLRYIALLALVKILPTHPHLVALHQEAIFDSMNDEDLTIRLRSLDLVCGMASRANFIEIVDHQLSHIDPEERAKTAKSSTTQSASEALRKVMLTGGAASAPALPSPWITSSYRAEIIKRILDIGSADTYTNIVDFEWYVDILVKLNYLDGDRFGNRIQEQLIDVSARVRAVRPHAIQKMKAVLEDIGFAHEQNTTGQACQIYGAAGWICGEYCQQVAYAPAVIELLLQKNVRSVCDEVTLVMLIQNAVKLFAWWLLDLSERWTEESGVKEAQTLTREIIDALHDVAHVDDVEVRERSGHFIALLTILQGDLNAWSNDKGTQRNTGPKSLQLLSPLFFAYPLGPVSKKAQTKVLVSEGLDLDAWLVEPGQFVIDDAVNEHEQEVKRATTTKAKHTKARTNGVTQKTEPNSQKHVSVVNIDDDIDAIPIVQLQLDSLEQGTGRRTEQAAAPTPSPVVPPAQEPEEEPEEAATTTGDVHQVVRKTVNKNKRRAKGGGGDKHV